MNRFIILLLVASVCGCATPYQRSGFSGGFEDTRVGPTQFYVSVRGNGYTGETTLVVYFHRRAQELCRSIGFSAYAFDSRSEASTQQTPSTYTAHTNYHSNSAKTEIRENPGLTFTKHTVKGYVTCHTPFPNLPQTAAAPAPAQVARAGVQSEQVARDPAQLPVTFEAARKASVLFAPGMTREQVAAALGPPANVESKTAGENTGKPWQALIWNYRWGDLTGKQNILMLMFALSDVWRLNSWNWF